MNLGTMENAALISAFMAAIRRGAEIDVFADPLPDPGPAASGLTRVEAVEKLFAGIGVRLHRIPKLPGIALEFDNDLLSVGSCNWLCADRQGQYARQ